jgi:hypothetical protein
VLPWSGRWQRHSSWKQSTAGAAFVRAMGPTTIGGRTSSIDTASWLKGGGAATPTIVFESEGRDPHRGSVGSATARGRRVVRTAPCPRLRRAAPRFQAQRFTSRPSTRTALGYARWDATRNAETDPGAVRRGPISSPGRLDGDGLFWRRLGLARHRHVSAEERAFMNGDARTG